MEYSLEDFEQLNATNVSGFFHLTQRVAPVMLDAGAGHIVTITTSLVEQPDTDIPAALASLTKGGLQAATHALAIEFAARGVRVIIKVTREGTTPRYGLPTLEYRDARARGDV